MPTALRRPEPVTIEAFDRFVEADALHFEAVDFRINLARIYFGVTL